MNLESARTILADNFAPWVLDLGIRVDGVTADSATLRLPFSERLCRVGGIMCGQALVSGADTAMVIALCSAMGGFKPVTTVDQSVSFMRPITRHDARIEARVIRLGRSLAFCACEIREDGSDKPAVTSNGTYALLT